MKHIIKGFTVIELMIVLAIIGILLAVIVPAYKDWNERALGTAACTEAGGEWRYGTIYREIEGGGQMEIQDWACVK